MTKPNRKMTAVGIKLRTAYEFFWKMLSDPKEDFKKMKRLKGDLSRYVDALNKRIKRLEDNGLQDTPAYQRFIKEHGRFTIKGKTVQEVRAEVIRMQNFEESLSSTVSGVKKLYQEMAERVGIKNVGIKEIREYAAQFFRLYNAVENRFMDVLNAAPEYDSEQIMETIKNYIEENNINLEAALENLDSIADTLEKLHEQNAKSHRVKGIAIKKGKRIK